ncbi:hypothetical protein HaLaN_19923 [Haematococcus lacustris]|uniref:RAP domain-containing protein n=1 Tax=Haematococcus lacustris TaxID=44745 RepID=A0A699ZIN4_HAELA|nr:hypothetical protein HaLaN_19923 [Haematococcus lacustris]
MQSGMQARPRQCHAARDLVQQVCVLTTSTAASMCVPTPLPVTTSAAVSQPLPVHQSHETSRLEEVRTGGRAGSSFCGYRPPAGHVAAPMTYAPQRQYDPPPRPKQVLEQLVSAVAKLPFLSSSSQVEQTSQLLWCFADWARQPENRRSHLTQSQQGAVLALLQRMAGGAAPSPALQQFDARQLNMSAWSLGKLRPHLPAATVTSACTALARHSASSEAMKGASWRDWGNLLHGLATAGMECSNSSDLTWLCDQAVQLLPEKLIRGVASQNISMTLWGMAKSGYTGSAQPLLQSVTAAMSQGGVMRDAKPQEWANLIWAASKLPGCRDEAKGHNLHTFKAIWPIALGHAAAALIRSQGQRAE